MARVNTSEKNFRFAKIFYAAEPIHRNTATPESEKIAIANPPHPLKAKRRHGFEDVKIFEGVAACLIFAPKKKNRVTATASTLIKKFESRR